MVIDVYLLWTRNRIRINTQLCNAVSLRTHFMVLSFPSGMIHFHYYLKTMSLHLTVWQSLFTDTDKNTQLKLVNTRLALQSR